MGRPIKHYSGRIRWTDALGQKRSECHPTFEAAESARHRHLVEKERSCGRAGARYRLTKVRDEPRLGVKRIRQRGLVRYTPPNRRRWTRYESMDPADGVR